MVDKSKKGSKFSDSDHSGSCGDPGATARRLLFLLLFTLVSDQFPKSGLRLLDPAVSLERSETMGFRGSLFKRFN